MEPKANKDLHQLSLCVGVRRRLVVPVDHFDCGRQAYHVRDVSASQHVQAVTQELQKGTFSTVGKAPSCEKCVQSTTSIASRPDLRCSDRLEPVTCLQRGQRFLKDIAVGLDRHAGHSARFE